MVEFKYEISVEGYWIEDVPDHELDEILSLDKYESIDDLIDEIEDDVISDLQYKIGKPDQGNFSYNVNVSEMKE